MTRQSYAPAPNRASVPAYTQTAPGGSRRAPHRCSTPGARPVALRRPLRISELSIACDSNLGGQVRSLLRRLNPELSCVSLARSRETKLSQRRTVSLPKVREAG